MLKSFLVKDTLGQIREKIRLGESTLNLGYDDVDDAIKENMILGILSFFILFLPLYKTQNSNREFLQDQLFKNRTYKNCQSCAKVFSPIFLHGRNKDGTINDGFCMECYDNGEFINPELSAQEVIDGIKEKEIYSKSKFSKLYDSIFDKRRIEKKVTRMIRWKENPYKDTYQF